MALNKPVTGDLVQATDVSDIVDHLEGAACTSLAYHFRVQACNDFTVRLPDAAGGTSLSVLDSSGTEKAHIDSDGNIQGDGTLNMTGGSTLSTVSVTGTASLTTLNVSGATTLSGVLNLSRTTLGKICRPGTGCNEIIDVNFPCVSTQGAILRVFRCTSTSGSRQFIIQKGDGTGTATLVQDSGSGQLRLATTGSCAGVLIGGDTQLYRSAANIMSVASGDSLKLEGGFLRLPPVTNLTVTAGGAVTATQSRHTITGAGGTCDTLSTINGGVDGAILILQKAGTGTITVNSAGNIRTAGCSVALSHPNDSLTLLYDTTLCANTWIQIGFSDNC